MASLKNYFNEEPDFVPEPPMKTADDYTQPLLEDIYEGLRSRGVSPEAGQRSIDTTKKMAGMVIPPPEGELPSDYAEIEAVYKASDIASDIPIASAPVRTDAPTPVKGTIAPTTSTSSAPPVGTSSTVNPPPVDAGSGGDDDVRNLYLARLIAQNAAGFGGMGAGKNIDMGIADTLGERMKQIEALRAKRQERQEGLDIERSQNNQTLEYYKRLFPDKAEDLEASLRDATGKGQVFRQGLDAWLKREELQNVKRPTADARIASMGVGDQVKLDTLDLKRDIAKDNEKYRAVQAGLRQAELDLRRAENARKAVGAAEPSAKERSSFQAMMKPAENTAVALKDADTLNSLGEGMLVTGQPPAFLSRADIAAFNGVPFGQASRSQLAQSNPQAYDLLTKMAEIKTIIGHEYFGSALSPSEAERQRQFMDFSALDSPESLAKKMKNYHDTLSNKATVFLRPRVVGRPLGAEWTQSTGLDALSGEGGTFAGLLDAPKAAAPKAAEVKEPAVVEGKVRMLSPDNRVAKIPAAEVEARKAQGWKEAP